MKIIGNTIMVFPKCGVCGNEFKEKEKKFWHKTETCCKSHCISCYEKSLESNK